jgi:hypothetical protein
MRDKRDRNLHKNIIGEILKTNCMFRRALPYADARALSGQKNCFFDC